MLRLVGSGPQGIEAPGPEYSKGLKGTIKREIYRL